MKIKNYFALLLFICLSVNAFGQRCLEIKPITDGVPVFSGKDDEAGMEISCPANIELTFESSMDRVVDVFNKEVKGEENFYYLRFKTGKAYRGRRLTIMAKGYAPLAVMAEMEPKELRRYQLVDPDAEFVYGCYYEYRKRGTEFFQKSMYVEAREQYCIAKECSDCPETANLNELIAKIDTINVYHERAEELYKLLDYGKAGVLYSQIAMLNPSDVIASDRRLECVRMLSSDCFKYYNMAQEYAENNEYDKSILMYQKVIDMNCSSSFQAMEELKKIKAISTNRKQRAKVYAYEYSPYTPIGLTTGSYKEKKVGGYFSLSFHQNIFNALQKDYQGTGKPEFNVSFGWTVNPVKKVPVWIFFGLGYTGVGEFVDKVVDDKDNINKEEETETEKVFKVYSAISPEVGILGKIGPVVLRYTFQVRIALSSEYKNEIKNFRHSFGLGFCF